MSIDLVTVLEATLNRKSELDKAFESAQHIDERIEIFMKQILTSVKIFEQSDLVKYPLSITQNLLMLPLHQIHQQVFSFGKAALKIFVHNITCFGWLPTDDDNDYYAPRIRTHGSTLYFACVYYLLGSACLGLERYYESLGFFEWADSNLIDLVRINDRCDRNCVWHLLAATHRQLYNLKVAMGKRDQAVVHVRKALRFKKRMFDDGCIELGNAYFEAFESYVAVMDTELALPFGLNALEIYARHHGPFSREVALLRVDLAVLFLVRGAIDMANEQTRVWRRVLLASSSDYVNAEIKTATMLIHLGRGEEAIEVMRVVASHADTERGGRVTSFVKMASASCILGRFDDAEKYMGEAKRLEENDVDPIFFGNVYVNMSMLYEKMKDVDTAISLLKRVLEMVEYYQKILPEGSKKVSHQKLFAVSSARLFSLYARLFLLFSLAGWEKEEMLLFMIDVMKKLEEIFGLEHIEVGYGYARLGVALMKSGKATLAVTLIEKAKYIMDVVLGPNHMHSLRTSHTLHEIYVKQRRFFEAIEIQAKIVEGSQGLGPNDKQFVKKLLDY